MRQLPRASQAGMAGGGVGLGIQGRVATLIPVPFFDRSGLLEES